MKDIRSYNIGNSDYSKRRIQPWDIWISYKLNPFDADIVKRVLRNKKDTPRSEDYAKIIHVSEERIRQIDTGEDSWFDEFNNSIDYDNIHIQPMDICIEYKLNSFDANIIECVLKNKISTERREDYTQIIYNCNERLNQINKGS